MLEGLDGISAELARNLARLESALAGDRPEAPLPGPAIQRGGPDGGELARIWAALRQLSEREAPSAPSAPAAPGPDVPTSWPETFEATVSRRLELLRQLIRKREPLFEATLSPQAPEGHAYAEVENLLGLSPGGARPVLEDLADLGLLQRELINRVHLCPECSRCQLNFREQCPSCESIDLRLESLVHHFRCGYTGLESEFAKGFELVCPKCRNQLFQLGQDFDRPHETYLCRACSYLFEEPRVHAQCLSCAESFPSFECQQAPIHRYRPTPLTVRAVELGRLTGLEVDSILYDADLQIATRDFLDFEIEREVERLNRYATTFCTCLLQLEHRGTVYPIFREWSGSSLRELCLHLARSLRTLDLVTRVSSGRIGILMPETDARGAQAVRKRLQGFLEGFRLADHAGHELTPNWTVVEWTDEGTRLEQVLEFFRSEEDA